MALTKKPKNDSLCEDELKVLNWNQYSDNYISATAPNGHTVLASKSAGKLSVEIVARKVRKKSLTIKST